MNTSSTLLQGYSDLEKGAYLGAIASIATADRSASEEEMNHLTQLCTAAGLSAEQQEIVLASANEISGEDLKESLEVLKTSELRFSLVTDLIAFAKADENYSEAEEQNVQKIAEYLEVNQQQMAVLDQFAEKTSGENIDPQAAQEGGFLSSLGLKDKMQAAGINGGGLLKSLISLAAPMILGRLMGGGRRSMGGGLAGGLGGMLGGGGLGSLIGMLSGGRGTGSAGGLLGRILGGRR
ncbi:MAG: TerB family tellurite resistance protein [Bacteroidota bacterium]